MNVDRRHFLALATSLAAAPSILKDLALGQDHPPIISTTDSLGELTGKPRGRWTLTVITGPYSSGKLACALYHTARLFFLEDIPPSINLSLSVSQAGLYFQMACTLNGIDFQQFENGTATPTAWDRVSRTLIAFSKSRAKTESQIYFEHIWLKGEDQIGNLKNDHGVELVVTHGLHFPRIKHDPHGVEVLAQLKNSAVKYNIAVLGKYLCFGSLAYQKYVWTDEWACELAQLGFIDSIVLTRINPATQLPEWRTLRCKPELSKSSQLINLRRS